MTAGPPRHDEMAALLRSHTRRDDAACAVHRGQVRQRLFRDEGGVVRVGRYVLEARIGRGAEGSVFRARDPALERAVAIKLQDTSPGSALRRPRNGLREGMILARLRHPNVVDVYETGTVALEGRRMSYVAMEWVEGMTLDAWAWGKPWREIVLMGLQVAQGLRAAHQAHIVHGDVKPSNVLVDRSGRGRLSDFGVAVVMQAPPTADARVTPWGGTQGFHAPELDRGRIDARTDQYSLCKTLETLLEREGRRAGDVPGSVRRILKRGGASEPENRWKNLDLLITHLERALRSGSVTHRSAVVIGLLVLALSWLTLSHSPTSAGRARPPVPELSDVPSKASTPPQRASVFEARLERAESAMADADFDLAKDLLDTMLAQSQGLPPLLSARAQRLRAKIMLDHEPEQAVERLESAYLLALRHKDDGLATQTALDLTYATGRLLRRPEEGIRWLEHARSHAERVADAHLQLDVMAEAGQLLAIRGDFAGAFTALQRAVATAERLHVSPRRLGALHFALGRTASRQGRHVDARGNLERAIEILTSSEGPQSRSLEGPLASLGATLDEQGAYDEARKAFLRHLELVEHHGEPRDLATVEANLGLNAWLRSDFAEARLRLERARVLFGQGGEATAVQTAMVDLNLGTLSLDEGNPVEARRRYLSARDALSAQLGPEHPTTSTAARGLAQLEVTFGRVDVACLELDRLVELHRRRGDRSELGYSLLERAKARWARGSTSARRSAWADALEATIVFASQGVNEPEAPAWLAAHRWP